MNRKTIFILVLIFLVVTWVVVAPFLATFLIVEKPRDHADAIIVLSGSAVFRERTRRAAELYKQGVASRVILTDDGKPGGWSQADLSNPLFVTLEERDLIANGVPPEAIAVLPGQVSGTDHEALALAVEIEARPVKSVLIVTSAYHTRRALRTFKKILAGKDVEIGIASAPPGDLTPNPNIWWLKRRGWQMVAGEYVKSVVYWVLY